MASPTVAVLAASPTPIDKIIRIAQAVSFPIRAWYCIGSFIGFVSLCHFISLFYRFYFKSSAATASSTRDAVRYRRIPSASLSVFRALAFRWTLPIGESYTISITEIFLTGAYMAIVFTWSMVNSDARTGLKYDPHYWANTAGHVVATQIPLMIALGMKNNLISLLTGISFNKLNFLHRMTARVLAVLIWVHGSGRISLGMFADTAWTHPWIQCGVLAATSLTVLSIISIRPIRNRTYEIFVTVHLILALIFVLAAYFHTRGTEKSFYIWPSFLIWGLDRLLRALRIVVFNFGYLRLKSTTELDARVEVLSPQFIRITLRRPSYFHWVPGQCAYLTIPGISLFQAHPFTISSIDSPYEALSIEDEKLELEKAPVSPHLKGSKELVFFCRVRKGFTENLRDASRDGGLWKIILDGPYSTPPILRGFETIVLIAGGSGVTFTLPLLLDIVNRSKAGQRTCSRLVFVWVIRDISLAGWMSDVLVPVLQHIPSYLSTEIHLCVTGKNASAHNWESNSGDDDTEGKVSTDGSSDSEPALFQLPMVRVQQGRPDLELLMKNEIDCASGDIAVNVCGPVTLANGVRFALRYPRFVDILQGGPAVTLHVETFGM